MARFRHRFNVSIYNDNYIDREIADYLFTHENGHARQEALRTLIRAGFSSLIKSKSKNEMLLDSIDPASIQKALLLISNMQIANEVESNSEFSSQVENLKSMINNKPTEPVEPISTRSEPTRHQDNSSSANQAQLTHSDTKTNESKDHYSMFDIKDDDKLISDNENEASPPENKNNHNDEEQESSEKYTSESRDSDDNLSHDDMDDILDPLTMI